MQAVSSDEFLKWTATHGITFDERYPGARSLGFAPLRDHSRFWTLPADPASLPHFIASIVGGLDQWSWGLLWPRGGVWPAGAAPAAWDESVRAIVLRGINVPEGWPGAIRFDRDECAEIDALMFTFLIFGWCVDDDLYFIPENGRQLVMTDHHGVIHVECKEQDRIDNFAQHMSSSGYELPTELPR
jgi:hypothetical protein